MADASLTEYRNQHRSGTSADRLVGTGQPPAFPRSHPPGKMQARPGLPMEIGDDCYPLQELPLRYRRLCWS